MLRLWLQPDLYALLTLGVGGPLLAGIWWTGSSRLAVGASILFGLLASLAAAMGLPVETSAFLAGLAIASPVLVLVRKRRGHIASVVVSPSSSAVVFAMVGPLAMIGWFAHAAQQSEGERPASRAGTALVVPAVPLAVHAVTDRGRLIPLYSRSDPHTSSPEPDETEQWAIEHYPMSLVSTAPEDARCNCFGWVFTGGRFIIRSAAIDPILEDNGYQAVNDPRAGDVVIFRDSDRRPVHVGVVRLASKELVLVESKWGLRGRFLCTPEVQAFGQSWTYYRSPRGSNVLRVEDPKSPALLP
jgi:hypothetical protein